MKSRFISFFAVNLSTSLAILCKQRTPTLPSDHLIVKLYADLPAVNYQLGLVADMRPVTHPTNKVAPGLWSLAEDRSLLLHTQRKRDMIVQVPDCD